MSKQAWDAGASWLISAQKAWERLGDLKNWIQDPRRAQRQIQMLRSELEEAEEKAEGRSRIALRKVLGTLKEMVKNLNRVGWSLAGDRLREETMNTIDDMRRQIEMSLPSTARVASEDDRLLKDTIRLAYENPELRPVLLPLIKPRS